ncbi:uncharacterized protein LODBEIA_P37180 [Lodderomyces beijingensis]|uniref:SH3 domain-containing protein n=1 Tax=Lodderomyces beijingensis TaxID=1775926 RepID=A0ABP0ZMY7_9ASCO
MVAEGLKSFSNNIGSHIKDAYKVTESEVAHLGHNLKNTVTFYHRDLDLNDRLLSDYKHDIKQARSGLKHLVAQNNQLFKKLIPGILAINAKAARDFTKLIGPGSLQFENIEKFYHELDEYEAQSIVPHVHPKERQFLIESVNEELYQYTSAIETLRHHLKSEGEWFADSMAPKIKNMKKRLDETLKLINKRDRSREDHDRLDRKIAKLNQKQPPLSEKDQQHLEKLQTQFDNVDKEFNALDFKAITLLPHIMSLLDEFMENVVEILIFRQTNTFAKITETLKYYAVFYGMVDDVIPSSYENIINEWEQDATTIRLQIESFLHVVQHKNGQVMDEEIDDADKASKTHKFWVTLSTKMQEKKHTVKPFNPQEGMFNTHAAIDPIVAYEKYQNPQANQLETYHPRKILSIDDVIVPEVEKVLPVPPQLPPRQGTAFNSSMLQRPYPLNTMPSQPHTIYSQNFDASLESLSLSDDMDDNDDDVSSVMSDSSDLTSLSAPSMHHSIDKTHSVEKPLRKIINSSKNAIRVAPVTTSVWFDTPIVENASLHTTPMTEAYKLAAWEKFFSRLDKSKKIAKVAKYDFKGQETGDLSFVKGDTVEVVFNFQSVDTLYMRDNLNWCVGVKRSEDATSKEYRIGLVPNNYLE